MQAVTLLSFACVYVIWGSTYLAIKYAVELYPPLWMSGIRFAMAGAILLILARMFKQRALTRMDRKIAWLSGPMLATANGLVCVAEVSIPSGVVALVIGSMPIWILILSWAFYKGARPRLAQVIGALVGLAGVALLAAGQLSGASASHMQTNIGGIALLSLSILCWANGTLVQSRSGKPQSLLAFAGEQVLAGSVAQLLLALIFEGTPHLVSGAHPLRSTLAMAYLVVFGSVIAFTAYAWLARTVAPSRVATYALVNPVLAVWLGWLVGNEALGENIILATLLVLAGLYFVLFTRPTPRLSEKEA